MTRLDKIMWELWRERQRKLQELLDAMPKSPDCPYCGLPATGFGSHAGCWRPTLVEEEA